MNNDILIDRILGLDESEETKLAHQAIRNAQDLEMTVSTPGWGIILDMFEDIKLEAENMALDQIPGNTEQIIAAHAVAFAVRTSFKALLEKIQEIRNSRTEATSFLTEPEYD